MAETGLFLRYGFVKFIGNGESLYVLHDPWIFDIPVIRKPTFINMNVDFFDMRVCDFLSNGSWNLDRLSISFNDYVLFRILSILISCMPDKDKWVWASYPSDDARPCFAYKFSQQILPRRVGRTGVVFGA